MKNYCIYPEMTKITFPVDWRIQIETELEESFKTKILVHQTMWPVKMHSVVSLINDLEA